MKAGPEGLTGGALPEAVEPVDSLVGLLLVAPAAEPEGPGYEDSVPALLHHQQVCQIGRVTQLVEDE